MNRIEDVEDRVIRLERQLAAVRDSIDEKVTTAVQAIASTLGAVINFLRNGDLSWSENHYNDAPPPSGADDEKEAAYFYTHAAGTTALVDASAQAVSSTGHAVNNPAGTADPQWDKVNGVLQWGSDKSVDCPLPRKMAQPSKLMYVGLVARKRSSSIVIPAGLKLGIGFHDNTAGQRKYLEGGQFTLSAAVVGAPAGTTSRKYKIVATTDWGETYESNEVTLAGAPSDPSYITNSVYVRLDWTKVIGVTRYDIYRLTGATYVLAGQIFNGVTGFNEMNNYLKSVTGYPTTSGTNARAYVEIPFDDLTTSWEGYLANVPVPQTYDSSVTTDKQWLRLTLSQALAAGSEQGIEIDKIYVSWNFGNFAPAPEDASAKQEVDTSATSSTQGEVGTGGGGDPPDPGEGGRCVWAEAMIQCYDAGSRRRYEIPAREVTLEDLLVSIDESGNVCAEEIAGILEGRTSRLYTITSENAKQIPCSPTHPIIQRLDDDHGQPAALLRKGDAILTLGLADDRAQESAVAAWEYMDGLFPVRMFQLRSGRHLFVAGGIVSHNVKILE
jgi:hypothetical protein